MGRKTLSTSTKSIIGLVCANCGSVDDLQYHHIVPLSLGGNDVESNIVCLCGKCHSLIHFAKQSNINHSECVKQGLKAAKKKGVHLGKKNIDKEPVIKLIAENSTQFNPYSFSTEQEVMEMAGVKRSFYCECKRMLIAAMKSDKWPYSFKKPTYFRNMPYYDSVIKRMRGDDSEKARAI